MKTIGIILAVIIGADSSSFKVLAEGDDEYAVDKEYVFYRGTIIFNVDITTFKVITHQFSKDKNHVYYFEKYLVGVNSDEFSYSDGMYGESIDDFSAKLGQTEIRN